MNNKTRKELEKVVDIINDLKEILTTIIDEEQNKFDNLPDGLQQGDNGIQMEDAVSNLQEAIDHLDDTIGSIETVVR
jgi:hypothetical protein